MNPRKQESMFTASAFRMFVVFGSSLLFLAPPAGGQDKEPVVERPEQVDLRLGKVRRICVQSFGPEPLGVQVQEMVIAKLFQAKRFSLTEDCDRADFVIKGSITERNEYQTRSESEGMGFGTSASYSTSSRTGNVGSSSSGSGSARGNAHESLSSSEVKQQAAVTLRVVDQEGEIIWATSQESAEGKSKGAITLAAEQAVRGLLRDIEKAKKESNEARLNPKP